LILLTVALAVVRTRRGGAAGGAFRKGRRREGGKEGEKGSRGRRTKQIWKWDLIG